MDFPEKEQDPSQELGYELAKQELFFRKELIERVHWFTRVRWFAAGGAATLALALRLLEPRFPFVPFTIIVLGILIYNLVFLYACRRLDTSEEQRLEPFVPFAHIQISMDLLALYMMIYLTGGIYSPLLMFVIFHIIIAAIFFPPFICYLYSFSSLLATGDLVGLEAAQVLPKQHLLFKGPLSPHSALAQQSLKEILLLFAFFGAAVFITAFLVSTIVRSLWAKGQEILKVSKALDSSNTKLTALYEVVKRMRMCSDLKELLDTATHSAASIMGVKGASIKLLDETRRKLVFS